MTWTRASTLPADLAQRARIVLLTAEGVSHTEIADGIGGGLVTTECIWECGRARRGRDDDLDELRDAIKALNAKISALAESGTEVDHDAGSARPGVALGCPTAVPMRSRQDV
jgi:hypothetical protein